MSGEIKDRTTTKTKENDNPVQVDTSALMGAASESPKEKELREKTAHIGKKTQDPKEHGVEKIDP